MKNGIGACLAFMMCLVLAGSAAAAEQVGKVANAKTAVTSGGKPVDRGDPIFFMDRLATNSTGVGEFVFDDGTRLAIGPSASVVVDRFVVKNRSSFQKLGVKATKGAFRWVSGRSPSTAYSIKTPMGTMGVRGTAFDVRIVNGVTHVVLLNGKARFCAGSTCRSLNRSGDYISAKGGKISEPVKIKQAFKNKAAAAKIFTFLGNPDMLSSRFRVSGSNLLGGGGFGKTESRNSGQGGANPKPIRNNTPPPNDDDEEGEEEEEEGGGGEEEGGGGEEEGGGGEEGEGGNENCGGGNCGIGGGGGGGNGLGDEGEGND
jgi:hypothetical protein